MCEYAIYVQGKTQTIHVELSVTMTKQHTTVAIKAKSINHYSKLYLPISHAMIYGVFV